jgi:hypothetical protein
LEGSFTIGTQLKSTSGSQVLSAPFQRQPTFQQGGFFMFTQKVLQELLRHYSLGQEDCVSTILFQLLNELSEQLDRIELLLEKRQRIEAKQMKDIRRAMLSKLTGQLKHLEETHMGSITDLTAEVKALKQTLESTRSKFIGFE